METSPSVCCLKRTSSEAGGRPFFHCERKHQETVNDDEPVMCRLRRDLVSERRRWTCWPNRRRRRRAATTWWRTRAPSTPWRWRATSGRRRVTATPPPLRTCCATTASSSSARATGPVRRSPSTCNRVRHTQNVDLFAVKKKNKETIVQQFFYWRCSSMELLTMKRCPKRDSIGFFQVLFGVVRLDWVRFVWVRLGLVRFS